MNRNRMLCLLLLLAMLSVFSASGPANADTGGGNLDFVLTASLPTFPCSAPGCTGGTFSGTSVGALAGIASGNVPWNVEWIAGSATGGFNYLDSCDIPVGTAAGSGNLAASVGAVTGQYGTPTMGDPFPLPVVGVSVGFTFEWTRIGVTALVVTHTSVSIKVATNSGFSDVTVVSNHLGAALAAFAPTNAPATCAAPQPISAVVVGADAIAG